MDNSNVNQESGAEGSSPMQQHHLNQQSKLSSRRLSMTSDASRSIGLVSSSPSGDGKENKKSLVNVLSEDHLSASHVASTSSSYQQTKQSILSKFARAEIKASQESPAKASSIDVSITTNKGSPKSELDKTVDSLLIQQLQKNPPLTIDSKQQRKERSACDIKRNYDELRTSSVSHTANRDKRGNELDSESLIVNEKGIQSLDAEARVKGESEESYDVNYEIGYDNDQVLPVWPSRIDKASLEPSTVQHQIYSLKDYSQVSGPTPTLSNAAASTASRLLKSMSQDRKVDSSAKRMSECIISSSGHVLAGYLSKGLGAASPGTKAATTGKTQVIGGKYRNPSVTSHDVSSSASNFLTMGSSQATSVQSLLPQGNSSKTSSTSAAKSTGGSSTNLLSESRMNRVRKLFVSPLSLRTGAGTSVKHSSTSKTSGNARLSFQAVSSQMLNVRPHQQIMHAMSKSRAHHSRRSPMRVSKQGAPVGSALKSFRVYGCPLQLANNIYPITCFGKPDIYKQQSVPYILARLCNYIEEKSSHLTHEGIFRVSGNARLMEKLRTLFDRLGDAPLESESVDVATSASMLKMYLRELPEPLIPTRMNYHFITLAKKYSSLLARDSLSNLSRTTDSLAINAIAANQELSSVATTATTNYTDENHSGGSGTVGTALSSSDRQLMAFLRDLTKLVRKLPIENYNLLKYLACFLYRISLKQQYNKMCAEALGIVFGPNVFRIRSESYKGLKEQELSNQIMASIISHYKTIFDCEITDPLGNLIRSNESLHKIHQQENENARALAKKLQQQEKSSSHEDSSLTVALSSPRGVHVSTGSSSIIGENATSTAETAVKLLPSSRCPKHGHKHRHHRRVDYFERDAADGVADDGDPREAIVYVDRSEDVSETDDDADVDDDDNEDDDDNDLDEDCEDESYSPSSGSDSYCSSIDSDTVESIYEGDIEGEQFDDDDQDEDIDEEELDNGLDEENDNNLDYDNDRDEDEELDSRYSECGSETSYTPSSSHKDSDIEHYDEAANRASSFDSSSQSDAIRRGSSTARDMTSKTAAKFSRANGSQQQALSSTSCCVCKRRESAQLEANKLRIAAVPEESSKPALSEPLDQTAALGEAEFGTVQSQADRPSAPRTVIIVKQKPASDGATARQLASECRQSRAVGTVLSLSRRPADMEPSRLPRASAASNNSRQEQLHHDSILMTSSDNALDQHRKTRLILSRDAILNADDEDDSDSMIVAVSQTMHHKRHHQSRQHARQHVFSRRRSSSASSLIHLSAMASGIGARHNDHGRANRALHSRDPEQQNRSRAHRSVRRRFQEGISTQAYNKKSHNREHLARKSEHSKLTTGGRGLMRNNLRAHDLSIPRGPSNWKKGDYYVSELLPDHLRHNLRDGQGQFFWDQENGLKINDEISEGYFKLRSYNSDETLLKSQGYASASVKVMRDNQLDDETEPATNPSKQRRRFSGQDCARAPIASELPITIASGSTDVGLAFDRIMYEQQPPENLSDLDSIDDNVADDDDCASEEENGSLIKSTLDMVGDRAISRAVGRQAFKTFTNKPIVSRRAKCTTTMTRDRSSVISLLGDQLNNFRHSSLSLNVEHSDPLIGPIRVTKELFKSLKRLLRHGLSCGYSVELASILMKLTGDSNSSDYLDDYSACFVDHQSARSVIVQLEAESQSLASKNDSIQIDKTIQEQMCILLQQKIDILKHKYTNFRYIREHYNKHHRNRSSSDFENRLAGQADTEVLLQLNDDCEKPKSSNTVSEEHEVSSSFESHPSINSPTMLDSNAANNFIPRWPNGSAYARTTNSNVGPGADMETDRGAVASGATGSTCKFGTLCPVEFVFNIEKQLAFKRTIGSRMIKLNEMNLLQLQSEKLELQKNLLRFEHWFGRPTTKLEYQLVGHLYERYRAVKIINQRRQHQH